MIWFIDIDSTLNNLWESWAYHHNRKCMICKEPLDWHIINDWDVTKFVSCDIYSYLDDEVTYLDAPVQPYAQEAIEYLTKKYAVYAVTHCKGVEAITGKYKWIQRYFPMLAQNFITMKDKFLLRGDVLIDDNIDNLLSANTKYRVAFHQRWNEAIKPINRYGKYKGMYKMFSWQEVYDLEAIFLC